MKNFIYSIRKFAYWFLSGLDHIFDRENRAVILVFHVIDDSNWFFGNTRAQMEAYLKILSQHYRFISLSEMLEVIDKKKHYREKVMALTFDDGYHTVMSVAPLLAEYDIKPAVFVLSDPDNVNRGEMETDHALLTDPELMLLSIKYGWELGSHSATHEDLTQLNSSQLKKQISGSRQKLQKDFETEINYFAYPKGIYNQDITKLVQKSGYKAAFTMDHREIEFLGDKFCIPRVGINRTHSPQEVLASVSPSVIFFRRFLSRYINRVW